MSYLIILATHKQSIVARVTCVLLRLPDLRLTFQLSTMILIVAIFNFIRLRNIVSITRRLVLNQINIPFALSYK